LKRRAKEPIAIGDEVITGGQLLSSATVLAEALAVAGIRPGDSVGLCLPRSVDIPSAVLGIWLAGAAYVPLDPEYPSSRIGFIAADSGIELIVGDQKSLERAQIEGSRLVSVRSGSGQRKAEPLPLVEIPLVRRQAPPSESVAYVLYTSGSTGIPKGVVVSQLNVMSLMNAALPLFEFGPADRWALFHSYNFDFSVWELWAPILSGGVAVVVPQDLVRDPWAFADFLSRERITVLNQVPSVFAHVNEALPARANPLPSLRYVIFGGDRLDISLVESFWSKYRHRAPRIVNMYGITEVTVHATFKELHRADLRRGLGGRSVIGRELLGHVSIDVRDERGQLVPDGESGELWLRGQGLARGYHGREDLTNERFATVEADRKQYRYYRSGDSGRRLDCGELEFMGRVDDQLNVHGYRIEPAEIERILRSHPDVGDAVVTTSENRWGDVVLSAVIECKLTRSGGESLEGLSAHVGRELPQYMVPAQYKVVSRLPRTESGKVDRRAVALIASTARGRNLRDGGS
jgi:amino acid adenylation domain-containing protein